MVFFWWVLCDGLRDQCNIAVMASHLYLDVSFFSLKQILIALLPFRPATLSPHRFVFCSPKTPIGNYKEAKARFSV